MKLEEKKILTFLCALWPGGGYMYFGMMKKGALLMALFTALAGLTLTIGWKFLAFLLPVVWCYCFFDTFHVAKLPEKMRAMEDQDCFDRVVAFCKDDPLKKFEGKRTFLGVLILLGALYTMIYGVLLPFFRWGEQFYWVQLTLTVIHTAVVAVLLFMVGRHVLQMNFFLIPRFFQWQKESHLFFALFFLLCFFSGKSRLFRPFCSFFILFFLYRIAKGA